MLDSGDSLQMLLPQIFPAMWAVSMHQEFSHAQCLVLPWMTQGTVGYKGSGVICTLGCGRALTHCNQQQSL